MVKLDTTYPNNLIKIGANKDENDQIICEAKQTDIWFHLASFSSCHVIISCNKKNPIDKQMIWYCAELCKNNTKYKNLDNVKVNYLPIKSIKRTEEKGKVILKIKPNVIVI
jgi:predicted ribosome quality control (RQC) complex YloA/Tae2 family protein